MNTLKTMLGLSGLTLAFLWIGRAVGGQTGMMVALLFAAITNLVAYFYSDSIVLSMYGARPLDRADAPGLARTIDELAHAAGIPSPKLFLIPSPVPNAFATGRNPEHAAVAVTAGLLDTLSTRELRGVLAHELAHVVHRDILLSTVVATLVGALGMLADMARWSMFFGGGRRDDEEQGSGFGVILLAILMPFMALLIQTFISRQREFAADETGAEISGDPRALASALMRLDEASARARLGASPATAHMFIVNPLTAESIGELLSTHPSTRERVARLEALATRRAA